MNHTLGHDFWRQLDRRFVRAVALELVKTNGAEAIGKLLDQDHTDELLLQLAATYAGGTPP